MKSNNDRKKEKLVQWLQISNGIIFLDHGAFLVSNQSTFLNTSEQEHKKCAKKI